MTLALRNSVGVRHAGVLDSQRVVMPLDVRSSNGDFGTVDSNSFNQKRHLTDRLTKMCHADSLCLHAQTLVCYFCLCG